MPSRRMKRKKGHRENGMKKTKPAMIRIADTRFHPKNPNKFK